MVKIGSCIWDTQDTSRGFVLVFYRVRALKSPYLVKHQLVRAPQSNSSREARSQAYGILLVFAGIIVNFLKPLRCPCSEA